MVCQHCGMTSAPGIRRCPNCGRALTPPPAEAPQVVDPAMEAELRPTTELVAEPVMREDPWEDDPDGPSQPMPAPGERARTQDAAPAAVGPLAPDQPGTGSEPNQQGYRAETTGPVYEGGQSVETTPVNVETAPDAPAGGSLNEPGHVRGLVAHIDSETEQHGWIYRWIRALVRGIPYVRDNTRTGLQIVQSDEGRLVPNGWRRTATLYGRIPPGILAAQNEVELWGYNEGNVLVARRGLNRGTGAAIEPIGALPAGAVRATTLVVLALLAWAVYSIWQFDWTGMLNQLLEAVSPLIALVVVFGFLYWAFFRRR